MMKAPNFYAAGGLDRVGHRRKDDAWLEARLDAPATRFVPVWRSHNLIAAVADVPRAVLLERHQLAVIPGEAVLLGLLDEVAYFAVDLSHHEAPLQAIRHEGAAEFIDLRRVGPLLPRQEGALLAYARGIAFWHGRHRFCGVCGSATESREGGHMRRCINADCSALHFPRTDPAVIMLVTRGDRALLGHAARFPASMYSTLAGFVEPGESLEEAVAREVFEETGVRVARVEYHSSQPWPFPGSIMLGFYAEALGEAIVLDREELEDARWFTRAEIRNHAAHGFAVPRGDSIARRLIEDWVEAEA